MRTYPSNSPEADGHYSPAEEDLMAQMAQHWQLPQAPEACPTDSPARTQP